MKDRQVAVLGAKRAVRGARAQAAPVPSEYEEAKALMSWANDLRVQRGSPELRLLFAISNAAGKLPYRTQQVLNSVGRKKGVPDYFLPVPRARMKSDAHFNARNLYNYCGLFLELKRINAVPSDIGAEQREWGEWLVDQGYCYCLCKGARAAIKAIEAYLDGEL